MTTITINERTKAGKIVLDLAKILSVSNKGIAIETKENSSKKVITKDEYDPEFVAMLKERTSNEKFTPISTKSIWESI